MNFKEFLTKDSIVVAAFPILGYVIAIAYEYGYAAHFGYPVALVVVDLRMTLTSMILGVGYLYFLLRIFDFINTMGRGESGLARFVNAMSSTYIMAAVFVFASGFSGPFFYLGITLAVAYTIIYGSGFLFDIKKMGLSSALEKLNKDTADRPLAVGVPNSLPGILLKVIHEYGVLIVVVLALVFGAGRWVATTKNIYSYFDMDSSKYVIVAIYGDSVIGVKFKAGKLLDEYAVISKNNEAMGKIGVLNLAKQEAEVPVKAVMLDVYEGRHP